MGVSRAGRGYHQKLSLTSGLLLPLMMMRFRVMTCTFLFWLKGSESGVLPSKVNIEISIFLTMKYLRLNCNDKHHNLGRQILNVGVTYSFIVRPNAFSNITLYFCRFICYGAVYYFLHL